MTLIAPLFATLFIIFALEFLSVAAFVGRAMFNISSGTTGVFMRLLRIEKLDNPEGSDDPYDSDIE